jgi:homoaconitase/3-isopropylmalate dehydratase large subunit
MKYYELGPERMKAAYLKAKQFNNKEEKEEQSSSHNTNLTTDLNTQFHEDLDLDEAQLREW